MCTPLRCVIVTQSLSLSVAMSGSSSLWLAHPHHFQPSLNIFSFPEKTRPKLYNLYHFSSGHTVKASLSVLCLKKKAYLSLNPHATVANM